jgi:hypothetical protein
MILATVVVFPVPGTADMTDRRRERPSGGQLLQGLAFSREEAFQIVAGDRRGNRSGTGAMQQFVGDSLLILPVALQVEALPSRTMGCSPEASLTIPDERSLFRSTGYSGSLIHSPPAASENGSGGPVEIQAYMPRSELPAHRAAVRAAKSPWAAE